ncbi:UNVERIFIED_CONTAM: Scarecrow-like protein 6 [Sesamum latifolium]|uniref:Scarecrow-like protein 6 n=1 Tax=Sesamum latifolium TaxID=2727402 RepID=A0AAW2U3N5_9LAMI
MKGMPFPFDFEGKGVLELELVVKSKAFDISESNPAAISSYLFEKNSFVNNSFGEPTSVLDSARISSRPTSSSTLSSSLGGGGGGTGGGAASTDTGGVAAVLDTNPSPKWQQDSNTATSSNAGGADSELFPVPPSLEIGTAGGRDGRNTEKCAMEDWENVLSESAAASPSQEQSIFRWIMGDVEDPGMGSLNKVLQIGGGGGSTPSEYDFSGGFGVVDQSFAGDQFGENSMPTVSSFSNNSRSSVEKIELAPNPVTSNLPTRTEFYRATTGEEAQPRGPIGGGLEARGPIPKGSLLDTGQQEMFLGRQQLHHQLQMLPHYLQQRPSGPGPKPKIDGGDELGHSHQQQLQQSIIDQLYKAAELVQTGNPALAQGILARLNHQLSPIASFSRLVPISLSLRYHHSYNLLILPAIKPLLEVLEGFDRIHIVDFDIGYGGQWASLMQELALRNGGAPLLKITALVSTLTHGQLELSLTRENLIQFASDINIGFEFEVISIDSLDSGSWSLPFHVLENEAVAVNLPAGCLANHQLSVPFVLRFVKQLSPKIVVSVDRGCDRTDLPFANHIIHALQSYSNLLESLDAVNVNMDALQKIERFLLQPGIEKL